MDNFNPELLPDIEQAEALPDLAVWIYERQGQEYLLTLLDNSSFEGRCREGMERNINDIDGMTEEEYYRITTQLHSNQTDPIISGRNYSASDIKRHLRKLR